MYAALRFRLCEHAALRTPTHRSVFSIGKLYIAFILGTSVSHAKTGCIPEHRPFRPKYLCPALAVLCIKCDDRASGSRRSRAGSVQSSMAVSLHHLSPSSWVNLIHCAGSPLRRGQRNLYRRRYVRPVCGWKQVQTCPWTALFAIIMMQSSGSLGGQAALLPSLPALWAGKSRARTCSSSVLKLHSHARADA